ncbi:YbhB/YbcL family Raf kinase inhibitor-like protein [Solilutibacter silvestris]|uniref:Raf kinase inhibitor-like protein, YbhB/YbcL family n=1 Tax=Solilutibacter silvestris TaxID=1645665 RepID=A0A2K1Q0W4_9GAMM|nr:YbhB/YbcL family Raf kinase inhibitor-like protein [Lysobacter silvestris]PNS08686.1 Raf kinase inhibitor-like protein, YbhB/YbcL family [Lysobacter silvestris]
MKLGSSSFEHRRAIPAEFALGAPRGFGGNRNPHLAWSDAPEGTKSFALLYIDVDAPTDASLAGKEGVEIPVDHPRGDFVHWVEVDIPASTRDIAAGSVSDGVTKGGKRSREVAGARDGLNDYTGWFAGDTNGMRGEYHGYDGPYPPPNDLRMHRYFFRLFALDVAKLDVPAKFTAADVFRAMHGHVLDEAAIYGTYRLHA